jgi:ribosomal small subunit protein bTHX
MGKGDRKTKKGKISRGSYGKSRRPKKAKPSVSKKKTS